MASSGGFKWTRPAAISAVVAVVAYAASFLMAPTYLGYFTLYFPNSTASPILLAGVRGTGEVDQSAVRNFGGALTSPLVASGSQTATGIVESSTCAREVVRKLDLPRQWGISEGKAVKKFAESLSTITEKSGFLRVEFVGGSREQCEQALKAAYEHLERRANELTVNVSQKNRKFVEERYDLAKAEVDKIQTSLTGMLASGRLAGYEDVLSKYTEARLALENSRVQETVAGAVLALARRNNQKMIDWSRSSSANLLTASNVGPLLESAATDLQAKRIAFESAMEKFTDASPEVKVARRDLKLGEKIANELLEIQQKVVRENLTPELAKAKIELQTMGVTLRENEKLLKKFEGLLPLSAREFAMLDRTKGEFKAAMDQMAKLRGELEMARIAEVRDPSRFELVDPPQTELDPVGPRRVLLSGVAFLLALAVQLWPMLAAKMREAES